MDNRSTTLRQFDKMIAEMEEIIKNKTALLNKSNQAQQDPGKNFSRAFEEKIVDIQESIKVAISNLKKIYFELLEARKNFIAKHNLGSAAA